MLFEGNRMHDHLWPALPLNEWESTYATLHMWTQIIGKIRLNLTPLINHWWNVTFQVSTRGLATPMIHGKNAAFQIEFDFIDHQLVIKLSGGSTKAIPLGPMTVSVFYQNVLRLLEQIGIEAKIWPVPVEVQNPIPFEQDDKNTSYDPEYIDRFRRILIQSEKVFTEFRSRFIGKCSPVHFFWGSFDLAVTRFSGRRAPERPSADPITREAYSHEVISHGFWPGNRASGPVEREKSDGVIQAPAFYSYTAPAPEGLSSAPIRPKQAFYSKAMNEFILLYDDVRNAASPEDALMDFLESTYRAGADLAKWDRSSLERQ
jgi:hypothetical protein